MYSLPVQRQTSAEVEICSAAAAGLSSAEAQRPEEVAQFRRDRASWEQLLIGTAERDRELATVAGRSERRRDEISPRTSDFATLDASKTLRGGPRNATRHAGSAAGST